MMNQEQALTYWMNRFSSWAIAAVEPSTNASNSAQGTIVKEQLGEMAQTLVDGLLQGGYSPNQVATAITHGAYLTLAQMVRQYVPEGY
jgi:hypothetical protein